MPPKDLESVETVLARALGRIAARGGSAALLVPVWARLVGPVAAERSRPVTLLDGVLTVRCDSEAWRAALRPGIAALLVELQRAVAPTRLASITLEVG